MSAHEQPQGLTRRGSVLLMASLALNLLILGTIAGSVFASRGERIAAPGGPTPALNGGIPGFVRTLPKERRAALRESVEQFQRAARPLRVEAFKSRVAAADALVVEPFDPERLKAAMWRLSDAEARLRSQSVDILVGVASKMTSAERQQFRAWRRVQLKQLGGPPQTEEAAPSAPEVPISTPPAQR
jgi:uncharacterized membrane protein